MNGWFCTYSTVVLKCVDKHTMNKSLACPSVYVAENLLDAFRWNFSANLVLVLKIFFKRNLSFFGKRGELSYKKIFIP